MPVRLGSGHPEQGRGVRRASYALAGYTLIALVMTWPLARGLTRDVAWDLGDPVLNMWILAWDCEQFRAILAGHFSHVRAFFDANIFHPAPLTLAYSEHLVPQAIQIFPVYVLTGNPILCYNLLFLSTFILSGLGMYLFVRELTGNEIAAFAGGLLFAFAAYRIPQSSHLQVLSSQWMPFAFYGARRYFDSLGGSGKTRVPVVRRIRPLAGATAAVIAESLSCGYYMLYFSPFVAAYVLWELWRHDRWRDRRTWIDLVAAAAVVVAVAVPFVIPYIRVRQELQLARSLPEVTRLSADVYSYATASETQRFWGRHVADVFPKAEGELFPGAVIVVLAFIGLVRKEPVHGPPNPIGPVPPTARESRWRTWLVAVLAAVAALHALAAIVTILFRRVTVSVWLFDVRLNDVTQLLLRAGVGYALVLALSPPARRRAAAFFRSRGFFFAALVAAMWLSLGPAPQVLGRPLDLASPYRFLWNHVPGFDGLRVPARFAMIATLMLAVLGGYGAAAIARHRRGRVVLGVLAASFLYESGAAPFVINGMSPVRGFNTPEGRLYPPDRAPAVYKAVADTSADSVLAELPIGQTDFDLRAMFYSIAHGRPLLNGYSGFFPLHYGRAIFALGEVPRHPNVSMDTLRELGATHVIVHEAAYLDAEGRETTAVLRQQGARELFRDGGDVLLALP